MKTSKDHREYRVGDQEAHNSKEPTLCRLDGSDFKLISSYFSSETGRDIDPDAKAYFSEFPSGKVLINNQFGGFCYTKPFAPDILEIRNIFVAPQLRNQRLGGYLIKFVEDIAKSESYSAVLLVNSSLYRGKNSKSAKSFYLNNGYDQILTTSHSLVFSKLLTETG